MDRWTRGWRPVVAMLLLALVLRAPDFGDPGLELDEQWYLLVGDRMLGGAIPYLDIWDRKPVGLFLLYAGIRLLPGDGILAYQLVATLFAGLTAALVVRIAARAGAAATGGLAAGALYLLSIAVLGGQGGQGPVFYNLFVAAAVWLTLRLPGLVADGARGRIVGNGLAACGLVGIALQFKYTAAFEGAFVGLAHLWALRRAGAGWAAAAGAGAALSLAGLAPTALAAGVYAALGPEPLRAFWFANFVSITLRQPYPAAAVARKLASLVAQIAPLVVAAGAAGVTAWRARGSGAMPAPARLAWGWLAAALVGFASIGTFHDHYGLPLAAPLAAVGGLALGRSRILLAVVLGVAATIFAADRAAQPRDGAALRRVAAVMAAQPGSARGPGCPYVMMGDPILYHLARACLPTAYAFPNMLAQDIERGAIGIDQTAEAARVMRNRPGTVVTFDRPRIPWNRDSRRVIDPVLARDYRLALRVPRSSWHILVHVRRDSAATGSTWGRPRR